MCRLKVLDVGDGACSVLSSCAPFEGITVIDCGEWRTNGSASAAILDAELAKSPAMLETLVVSHFDADHWLGLQKLALLYENRGRDDRHLPPLNLIYPAMPKEARALPPTILALISTVLDTHVRAMDLRNSWAGVRRVNPMVLAEGESFWSSGRYWDVLWPPRKLPRSIGKSIARAIKEVKELADELAANDRPLLRDNLQQAYDLWGLENADHEDLNRDTQGLNRDEPAAEAELDAAEYEADPALPEDFSKIPLEFLDRFQRLSRRLGRANNFLSLVVKQECNILALGDVQGWALTSLLERRSSMNDHIYRVLLAPHHGTVQGAPPLPSSFCCISQLGENHIEKWKHADSHSDHGGYETGPFPPCENTFTGGSIDIEFCDYEWQSRHCSCQWD